MSEDKRILIPNSTLFTNAISVVPGGVVARGGDACLRLLPSILREPATSGPVHGVGYNAGVQVVKTEDPPIGQRRPGRPAKPSVVRINGRDFMRVDYDRPVPHYLKVWRSAFERAVAAHPDTYENFISGGDGEASLRDIWKHAVAFGNLTWGGDAQDNWTEAYWEETIRWSSILTFGMETAGLAAFVALLNADGEAATRAVLGNALYLGATPGWLVGLLDTEAIVWEIMPVVAAMARVSAAGVVAYLAWLAVYLSANCGSAVSTLAKSPSA